MWNLKPSPKVSLPISRYTITLPPGDRLAPLNQPVLALSPDGTRIIYAAIHDSRQQLYMRRLDSLDATFVPGTEGATAPFISPDGEWIGFADGRGLKKIPVQGGVATDLVTLGISRGASWTSHGTISFTNEGSVVRTIPDSGGSPQPLVHLDKADTGSRWPEMLPAGRAVIFAGGVLNNSMVVAYEIRSNLRHLLAPAGTQPHYSTSGDLTYAQGGNLIAAHFDPERLQVTGPPVEVVKGVVESGITGAAQYSVSNSGILAYIQGSLASAHSKLVWVDRKGAERPLAADIHAYETPRIAPDGNRVAVSLDGQIWLYDQSRDALTRLTVDGSINNRPV